MPWMTASGVALALGDDRATSTTRNSTRDDWFVPTMADAEYKGALTCSEVLGRARASHLMQLTAKELPVIRLVAPKAVNYTGVCDC